MAFNPAVAATPTSPISESAAWLHEHTPVPTSHVLDVSQAVPGYPPAAELQEHLARVVHDPETSRYGPVLGLPEVRDAFAVDIAAAYAAPIEPSHVAITAGCNQAFCLAVSALAGPGDEVVLPVPFYFNHDMWLRSQGIKSRYLAPDEQLIPRAEDAERLLTDRTRAVVLITPNNPTGTTYPAAEIDEFYDLCRERGIKLILDETYRDFRADLDPPHRLFGRVDWPETLVHLYSFSKVYSMTGYRVGGLACSPAMLVEVEKLADCVAICAPRIGQSAALFGMRNLEAWVETNRQLMQRRVSAFANHLTEDAPQWRIAGMGAYFAYVVHPQPGRPGIEVARSLLEQQEILALAGSMFGPGQDSFLRLAFANLAEPDIAKLVSRMAEFQ